MPVLGGELGAALLELPSPLTTVYLPASAIVENMAEFRPEMCTEAAQQGLLQWLLKRLKVSLALWTAALTPAPGLLAAHPRAMGSYLLLFTSPFLF